MTELLFRDDAYLSTADATVSAVGEDGAILVDRSIFYAAAGGQPGDTGVIEFADGACQISNAVYDSAKNVMLIPAIGQQAPSAGSPIVQKLDWDRRYRNMRAHTLMHLLCACVPFPVTGGAISEDGGRIDFDIPEGAIPVKEELSVRLNALIDADYPVADRWITDDELRENAHLIRTMSVKPPVGTGRVRLVMIGENGTIDLQPCGGTHVRATGEIGPVQVVKIENKGKLNRRIRVAFA
jgi:misacylated tRNA(Ala) deacylase